MNHRGFTLIEIVIVTAIIAILSVAVIPQFLRARYNANESSAIATLRVYVTGLEGFRASRIPPTYPPDLSTLASEEPPYVDSLLGQDPATKQGYTFTYDQMDTDEYQLLASPAVDGVTGTRIFFVDQSGVIRLDDQDGAPIE
ncbi:MAG: prepilin-type N-terminal cleavage/methylation domain-containing protein [Candidatus Omnitrophica bacterium]|nr:prepilin-type N-terminal cleavage/methylation domain-containing protein [Candidatus Omnitrophota bacterium]